jgi:Acetylornithine deacetylase/Succinyl-diaminopimelate desuccinylase and related deacylases
VTATTPFDVEALLEELVRLDSRNPDLSPDSPGEGPIAARLAEVLTGLGLEVAVLPAVDGRPNVIGVLQGTVGHATVVFEAHLDTVPAEPETMRVHTEGRLLFGRGTCDTKGSLASMVGAAERMSKIEGPRPTIVIAGVADEEYIMRGARELLGHLPKVDAVVIGEPTSMLPVRAHNGFIRVRAVVTGIAAHSSKAHLGVNAIAGAAIAIARLEQRLGSILSANPDPVSGPAYLTPTMIEGGIAPNVVPDRCEIWYDRRLSPDETADDALADIETVLQELRDVDGLQIHLDQPIVALHGFNASPESPLVVSAERAVKTVLGQDVEAGGVTYSTDACYLAGLGNLPCVILGPGSIDQAHAIVEWVDLDEVVKTVDVYVELAMEFDRMVTVAP